MFVKIIEKNYCRKCDGDGWLSELSDTCDKCKGTGVAICHNCGELAKWDCATCSEDFCDKCATDEHILARHEISEF